MWQLLFLVASVSAQIPSLGWCPDYQPMANFNIKNFLGTWYEAERYFTVSELGSRCVTTKYESTPEGRILVSNEITNSLTGFKRLMEGSMQLIGREGEGRIMMKYQSVPVPYENEYSILDTDYDNYAVMWSCSGIGPVHIQNAWILTRERFAPSMVMQSAYAALERFRISRTFFVKTNQADCTVLPEPANVKETEQELVIDAKEIPAVQADEQSVVRAADKQEKVVPENVVKERVANPKIPSEMMMKPAQELDDKKGDKMEKPEKMDNMKEEKESTPKKEERVIPTVVP